MKKAIYLSAILALGAISCAKEASAPVNEGEKQTIKVEVGMPSGDTKANFIEDAALVWEVGDVVMFYNGNDNPTYTLTADDISNEGQHAVFTFETSQPKGVLRYNWSTRNIAEYDFAENHSYITDDTEVYETGSTLSYTQAEAGTMNKAHLYMHSGTTYEEFDTDSEVSSKMHIIGTVFKVMPYTTEYNDESVKSVEFKLNTTDQYLGSTVNYTYDVDGTYNAPQYLWYYGVTVNLGTAFSLDGVSTADASKGIYFSVPATTAALTTGYTMVVTTDAATYTYTSDASLTVAENTLRTVALNLDSEHRGNAKDENIWAPADVSDDTHTVSWYYAPNWSQLSDPTCTFDADDKTYSFTLEKATYGQWQAQMFILPTEAITLSSDNYYDFSVVITSSTAQNSVTIKLYQNGNDDLFLFSKSGVTLAAGEATTIDLPSLTGVDISEAKLLFDFGGNSANTDIVIKDITLKLGSAPEEEEAIEYDSGSSNLWAAVDAAHTYSQYYAPGWSQLSDPEITYSNHTYSYSLPTATTDQWQAQFFIIPDSAVALSSSNKYDFQVVLKSSTDIAKATVKLTDSSNDGLYLFTENVALSAGVEKTVTYRELTGIESSSVKMVFDFGGNPANTDIVISNILLRVSE